MAIFGIQTPRVLAFVRAANRENGMVDAAAHAAAEDELMVAPATDVPAGQ